MRLYDLLFPTRAKADHQRAAAVDELVAGAATEAAARELVTQEIKHDIAIKEPSVEAHPIFSDLRWSTF
jgi:hypothetical protein